MHEYIARAVYHFTIHLLFASALGTFAWALTSIRGASATTKYWIWVVTAFNFLIPTAAVVDRVWAPHFTWARPLGAIGGPVWSMTQGRMAVMLAASWTAGALVMLVRLTLRIWKGRSEVRGYAISRSAAPGFRVNGIPVSFENSHTVPAVRGILHPHILLPVGIDRVLSPQELRAVLLHEVVHARRRDNLICLLHELTLCALWFHPLVWLAGARMRLFRELSCDESVIRRQHGPALASALDKLAVPERSLFLHARASSHMSHRLASLIEPPLPHGLASSLLTVLFVAFMFAAIFQTIAHTACCFLLGH